MKDDVLVQKLDSHAFIPIYAHQRDAGMDLFALMDTKLLPGERIQVRTGIALAIPQGYVGLIWDKSGLSHISGIKTVGGVIDSGYRGEVLVGIVNLGRTEHVFRAGDKVAQILIQKVEYATLVEVDTLPVSERGKQGFGSTGR